MERYPPDGDCSVLVRCQTQRVTCCDYLSRHRADTWCCLFVRGISETEGETMRSNEPVERMAAGGRRLQHRACWAAAIAHFSR
jgi:hypothetical protein